MMQYLSNTKLGLETIGKSVGKLDSPQFLEIEEMLIKNGLITPKVSKFLGLEEAVADIIEPGKMGKVLKLPAKVVKKALSIEEKRMAWGYNRLQRKIKVLDAMSKREIWIAKNPGATAQEIADATRKITTEVNAVYKSLNYKVLGYTQSQRDWLRIALLAPDYTVAKIEVIKEAVKKNPAALNHMIGTTIGSFVMLTQGLNVILNGHSTFQNDPGHIFDVQVGKGMYIKTMPDWVYDVANIIHPEKLTGKAGIYAQPLYIAWGMKKTGLDYLFELLKSPLPAPLTEMVDPDKNMLEKVLTSLGLVSTTGAPRGKSGSSTSRTKKTKSRSRLSNY
jgi:hypothetical protein